MLKDQNLEAYYRKNFKNFWDLWIIGILLMNLGDKDLDFWKSN